jgi:hypothetical protein
MVLQSVLPNETNGKVYTILLLSISTYLEVTIQSLALSGSYYRQAQSSSAH